MQSGISASKELLDAFNEVQSSTQHRGLIAGISKECLVPTTKIVSKGNFDADLAQLDELTKDNEAAYILLRREGDGEGFVAITYVPDTAHVRQKMLFASTRNTLLRELGTEKFTESIFATTKEEFTVEGFKRHAAHAAKPAPLTEEEQTLQFVKDAEAEASMGTMSRATSVPTGGFGMPAAEDAVESLRQLSGATTGLVQLGINIATEEISLVSFTPDVKADNIAKHISEDVPAYSFFPFTHTWQGREESPIIFLYTCPSSSRIKDRMIYASSRRSVVALAEGKAGLTVAKRLESDQASEITVQHLMDELHPKEESKATFSRPKRPGRH